MLDLVFLRLEVLNARGNLKAAASEDGGSKGDFDFLGAYAISVGALLPGEPCSVVGRKGGPS